MDDMIMAVLLIILCAICFHLGTKWEAYAIRNEITKSGQYVGNWGESSDTKFKIVGIIEEVK